MSSFDWGKRTLGIVLAVSITTNLIFVARLYLPGWREAWRLAHIPAPVQAAGDHVRGDPASGVTVIEFSDFQCPYCARLNVELGVLADQHRLLWIYRHTTGNAGHPQAVPAAEAAECAGEQGQFWEYSDALFSNQPRLGEALYGDIAATLRLDTARFDACRKSGKYRPTLQHETAQASELDVEGTPTWFVNGRRMTGAVDETALRAIVAAASKKAGVPGA
ncbi:MAG TPA: thioredoxin domain-containing protein [Gammaproteobacteria bacterium]|nr:thioredoxin domain-containing protein [Gammaproteobacteria bacterium]